MLTVNEKICPKCHASLPASARGSVVCEYCGVSLEIGGTEQEEAKEVAPAIELEQIAEDALAVLLQTTDAKEYERFGYGDIQERLPLLGVLRNITEERWIAKRIHQKVRKYIEMTEREKAILDDRTQRLLASAESHAEKVTEMLTIPSIPFKKTMRYALYDNWWVILIAALMLTVITYMVLTQGPLKALPISP